MFLCRVRTTELSQAMDATPAAAAGWPKWSSSAAHTGRGASDPGGPSPAGRGALSNLTARLAPPAVSNGAAAPAAGGSPPLHWGLLRNKHAGSADSNASSAGLLLYLPWSGKVHCMAWLWPKSTRQIQGMFAHFGLWEIMRVCKLGNRSGM